MGQTSIYQVIISFFSILVILFVCFPIHECAHAFVARLLGDDTAERQGRLTLNPFAHIDLMGAIAMCICCIGWAKPTPVDLRKCKKTSMRTANALVSLAGPLSNLIMSLLLMIIYKLILINAPASEVSGYVCLAIFYAADINVFLAVFNLLPIPPFDGYHILASVLPAKAVVFFERYAQIINFVMLLLLISGILSVPLNILSNGAMTLLDMATKFIC